MPLPPELRQALSANGGLPLQFEDPETRQLYLLVEQPVEIALDEDYIRQGVQLALDQFEQGESGPWDIEASIAVAKSRHGLQK